MSPARKRKKVASPAPAPEEAAVPAAERALPVPLAPAFPERLDPLRRYLADISRYPVMGPEEEAQVARRYRDHGDRESAQRLVLANLRLVVKIAMEYRGALHNILDLIQEGNLGLMRAVEKYDVDKNVRFSTYAVWWVRAYILKFITDNFRLVKIGTTQAQKKLFFNLMREKERIEGLGFTPTPKLLSERLNVKEREVREMEVRLGAREMELDAPKPHYEDAVRMDFIPAPGPTAEDALERGELKDILLANLKEFTSGLRDKEKQIFAERLFAEIPRTLQEIADEYGITRERIRQVENRVIAKMRRFFAAKGIAVAVKERGNS